MITKQLLSEAIKGGSFTIDGARELLKSDWRSMVPSLPRDTRREAETLFYFIEGFVEEVDEGFVEAEDDPELYEKIVCLLKKI